MTRILVVYKKSYLESLAGDRKAVAQLDPASRARLLRADAENRRSLAEVTAHLEKLGVRYDAVFRGSLAARRRYDLVVSLGGDGTFFATARYVKGAPILGVNSDPSTSLGLWTCADRRTFPAQLERALAGRLEGVRLNRMSVTLNGRTLPARACNDLLFAHRNPAAMMRYAIDADGRREDHRSSGVWVATAAGSTAGIRSAGGRRMPIESRRLQYVVREPYGWPSRPRLTRGTAARLAFTSHVTDGAIWLDGSRLRYDLRMGDRVELRTGADPLLVLGFDDRRRRRLFP